MFRVPILTSIILLFSITALAQKPYQHISLAHKNITAKTVDLQYPINMEDVKAIGTGNTQLANGKAFNAMMYNPAFLGRYKKTFDVLGLSASMPPETYDAAFFLSDNMDEFTEAVSLTQIWDGVNAFFEEGATLQQRLDALHQIQDGMQFTLDLVSEVTGSAEDPQKHGMTILPSVSVQSGHWGFSLYGFGHSGFVVQLSPTLETLENIEIPANLDNPVQAAKSLAQILGTLATVVVGGGESFSDKVYPVAFYLSYIDIVGAVGYGFQWKDNWMFGANLKVVNRRFIIDRIAVIDYEEILSDAWKNLQSNTTGVTCDVGGLYRSHFGTSFGLSLQNIIPIQSINKSIDTDFRLPIRMEYRTNAEGDTVLYSVSQDITVNRQFALKAPFIANIGICHPITQNWDVALDWVDIAEQDSRYRKTTERIRIGTEYRLKPWKDKLMISLRTGLADEKMSLGLGLNITRFLQIDGAYAYDRFVKSHSYFSQIKIGW